MYVKLQGSLSGVPTPDYRYRLSALPEGEEGVRTTLKIMRQFKNTYKSIPWVRNLADRIVAEANVPQKNYMGEISALFEYVRDKIRYARDVAGVEMLQTPDVTLHRRTGDCDDKSILLATLLEASGHPTRFIAIGTKPDRFSHVYVETKYGANWISLDPTEPHAAGWRPPVIAKYMRG